MAATAFVRARINEDIRDKAAEVLDGMGLTVSDVMRMTLTRIARDKALPIGLTVPNPVTLAAMEEARAMSTAKFDTAQDMFDALDKEVGR